MTKQLPDGFEWPRFEDGAFAKPGDVMCPCSFWENEEIESIVFDDQGFNVKTTAEHIWYVSKGDRLLRPPVLDKDGIEIKVGDTVWQEADGTKLRVIYFGHKEDGERMVGVERISGPVDWAECRSGSLTHIEPDSWEKLREDARKPYQDYWGCKGDTCAECPALIDGLSPDGRYDATNCIAAGRLDILARAEKLAGVMGDD